MAYEIRALGPETWDAYAALVAKHNGVFGGCWCTWFHRGMCEGLGESYEGNRDAKERLVREGRTHAALVFDGDAAVAWATYGTPEELPNIHHRKEYDAVGDPLPDYRITCIFVDRNHRRRGVVPLVLQGALDLIAAAGGGVVEGYPHDTAGQPRKSSSFLYNGTRAVYERAGFEFIRTKGKGNTVMRKVVAAAASPSR
jgi:ribosomal protein S18 acetylase RimI-like enzyme